MKVAGFTFIRNAVCNDYPIVEAITSILPICDEFVVAVGQSEDGTRALIESIGSDKIRIIDTIWDEHLREGGRVFAQETDKAFQAISQNVDWAFYIQGDECVHEDYLPFIKKQMYAYLKDDRVEGLLFKYKHFYGSYDYYAESRKWYRREIRIVRRKLPIYSYRDAQGFRIDDRKLRVRLINAEIFHYGWVKPPIGLVSKMQNFSLFYDKNAVVKPIAADVEFDYGNADRLIKYEYTHPKVMQKRIELGNWQFNFDPTKRKINLKWKYRLLQKIHDWTGIRLFEYKNYRLIN